MRTFGSNISIRRFDAEMTAHGSVPLFKISTMPSRILQAFDQLLSLGSDSVDEIGVVVPIPHIHPQAVMELLHCAASLFSSLPTVLTLSGDYYVIGDVHGNLVDLLRLLFEIPRPPYGQILFLGDIVDRGSFSTEVTILILALICSYPDHVSIIRGNHEFADTSETYGFKTELMGIYQSADLWDMFQQVFAWMPIAAVVNDTTFCVHGGPCQHHPTIQRLTSVPRPIWRYHEFNLVDLFWADPTTCYDFYGPSPRGIGRVYGRETVETFCTANRLTRIIRAHECVPEGLKVAFGGRVITVFSTSTGKWPERNMIAAIKLSLTDVNTPISSLVLNPGPVLERTDVTFKPACEPVAPLIGLNETVSRTQSLKMARTGSSFMRVAKDRGRKGMMLVGRSSSWDVQAAARRPAVPGGLRDCSFAELD
jgi:diadenosine tetraphosphatase ApaH/serine/threonine PP2A family protein phosphatase